MKFITFAYHGQFIPGVLSLDGRHTLALSDCGLDVPSLEALARFTSPHQLRTLRTYWESHPSAGYSLEDIVLLPAIPAPTQEILIMENNFLHNSPELPTYYYKKATFANGNGGRIPLYPGHVTQLDYQAELCAVVGGDVYQVPPEQAQNHIFGYLIINNIITRNLTQRHRRPYIATSLDGFLPMSAYLVTPDEIPQDIAIRSWVNGQLRQDTLSSDANFSFSYAIADLSRISVLRGGSIISLGTPCGTGADQIPPEFLRSGDCVTCQADGVGSVTSFIG